MKVAILAAGIGSRLGAKTKCLPKALIKIGDVASISHIINYFPKNYEFIIVINHLGDLIKQYIALAHPELNVKYVLQQKLNGPGQALLECKEYLNEPFYVWCSDTLIENPILIEEETYNWIGYAKKESLDGEYSSISCHPFANKLVKDFFEKGEGYSGNAYIGCAFIKNYEEFFEGMEKYPVILNGQYQVSAGFRNILNNDEIDVIAKEFIWHDTGNLENLQKTRENFKGRIENLDKEEEELYFFGEEKVVKFFNNSKICKNRVTRNKLLGNCVPKIIAEENNFYSYEYIKGKDLYCLNNSKDYLNPLLSFANDNLWKEKNLSPEECIKFHEACVNFYYRKTKERIAQLYSKLQICDIENTINGEKIPKLFDIFNKIKWKNIFNGTPTLMHGDFNFSNVLVTEDNSFKFIDIRQDFGGIIEYADMHYDLAKLYSGFLFPHDVIKNKQYTLSIKGNDIEFNIKKEHKYTQCKMQISLFSITHKLNWDIEKIKQLAALVLLNMSPLHESPLDLLLYYLGKYELYKTLKQ